jgi:hypothetical protein
MGANMRMAVCTVVVRLAHLPIKVIKVAGTIRHCTKAEKVAHHFTFSFLLRKPAADTR